MEISAKILNWFYPYVTTLEDQPCTIDLFLFTAGGNLFKTKFLGLSENDCEPT